MFSKETAALILQEFKNPSFFIGEYEYKASKLPAFIQLEVARRVTSILQNIKGDTDIEVLSSIAGAFGKLSTEDSRYLFNNLLSAITRKQSGGGFAPIKASGNTDHLMFDDIDLMSTIQLMVRAAVCNVGNFSNALPSILKNGSQQA